MFIIFETSLGNIQPKRVRINSFRLIKYLLLKIWTGFQRIMSHIWNQMYAFWCHIYETVIINFLDIWSISKGSLEPWEDKSFPHAQKLCPESMRHENITLILYDYCESVEGYILYYGLKSYDSMQFIVRGC